MTRLTAHFRVAEFDCRDGTPVPRHAYGQLLGLCQHYLEPLRAEFGPVTIVSGYRTREHNRRVGGAARSFHVYQADREGVAADLRCARGTLASWHRTLDRLGIGGLSSEGGHLHADTRAGHARW